MKVKRIFCARTEYLLQDSAVAAPSLSSYLPFSHLFGLTRKTTAEAIVRIADIEKARMEIGRLKLESIGIERRAAGASCGLVPVTKVYRLHHDAGTVSIVSFLNWQLSSLPSRELDGRSKTSSERLRRSRYSVQLRFQSGTPPLR